MTKEELDAFLASEEARLGLMTGELRSIWQQESGKSVDPTLKGPALSKGRGNAVGPMQVVPYFHKDFPANGTVAEQAAFASNLYAKGGKTPEERAASYYGRGVAPNGHPTTAQYQQQVVSRLPQNNPTPQESNMETFSILDTVSPESEEERKRRQMMEYVNQQSAARQAAMQQRQPAYEDAMPQRREPDMFEKMMSNPLTQMGAAMMASSGTDWGRAGGMGLMAANNAIYNRQQAENELWELQEKRKEALAKRRREERKDQQEEMSYEQTQRLADMYEAKGDLVTAQQIRAGTLKTTNPAAYGTTPHYERDAQGNISIVRYASDGTKIVEPAKGTPFAVESKLPGFQSQVEEGKATGKKVGEANADTTINAPKEIAKADTAMSVIDKALTHPGLAKAVGIASAFPTIPGTDAADYETVLGQVTGGAFLQAFESLRGGGAITEIEGQKATNAITSLNLKQSEAEHRRALADLKEVIAAARARAAAGVKVPNPYGTQFVQQGQPTTPQAAQGVRRWNREKGRFE